MSYFRQIQPSDKAYNLYLVWLTENGGIRQWLFSHTAGNITDTVGNFTIESQTDIRSIPESDRTTYAIATRFLNEDEYTYCASLLKSNRVYQVLTDGSQIPVAVKGKSLRKPNQDKSFELEFEVSLQEENILNV
jgi:hypothetical protein